MPEDQGTLTENSDRTKSKLSRRSFVGGVAGAALVSPGLSGAASAIDTAQPDARQANRFDVVVIGGGFAGVTAARDLQRAGYSTILLEARDRLGGRTFTRNFQGDAIEMGGTWVHNSQPFVWSEMQRYGIDVVETPGAVAQDFRWLDGDGVMRPLTLPQFESLVTAWQTFSARAREILPRPFDLMHNRSSVLEAEQLTALEHLQTLPLDKLQNDFVRAMVSLIGDCAEEDVAYIEMLRFHMLAGDYFPTFMDASARFQIEGGTQHLIQAIANEGAFAVQLECSVTSVTTLQDGIEVRTASGELFSGRAAICTLPLNTLNSIDFVPPKPAAMTEVAALGHPGNGHKIFLKLRGDVGNLAGFSAHEQMHYLMTYKQHKDYTLVVAFVKRKGNLDVEDNGALQAALRRYIPDAEVMGSTRHDWLADPLARGTWATFRPGWLAAFGDAMPREMGALQFASGDIGEGWRGTIDGAVRAGTLAARQTIEKLG